MWINTITLIITAYIIYWIVSLVLLYALYLLYMSRIIKTLKPNDFIVLKSGIIGRINDIDGVFFKITIVDGCDCTVHYKHIGDVVRDFESIQYIQQTWGDLACRQPLKA